MVPSANQSDSVTIGDYTYVVAKMLGRDGARFSTRTAPCFFPLFAELSSLAGKAKAGSLSVDDLSHFGPMFLKVLEDLNKTTGGQAEVDYLNDTLGKLTQVCWTQDGQPYSRTLDQAFFDTHFQDRLDAWSTWLVFALRTQLSSFFVGVLKLGAKLQSGPQQPAQAPPKTG